MANQMGKDCPLAAALAGRLRASRLELTTRWLTRIVERVSIDPNRVFPTDELLDHVPLLIDGIASYLENPAAEISVDMPVVGKAMELGALGTRRDSTPTRFSRSMRFSGESSSIIWR